MKRLFALLLTLSLLALPAFGEEKTKRVYRAGETEPFGTEETLLRLADLFKVFGDGTRVRILFVLLTAEVCVCDLAKLLGMTQSAVSHQLRVLKQARLIKARRDGKTVFYSLADDHVATLLRQGMEHVCEGSGGECGE